MPKWFTDAQTAVIIHWVIVVRILLYSLVTLGTCWMTASQAVVWDRIGPQEKIGIFIGCFVLWGNAMMAFMDKSVSRISKGELPFESSDTVVVKKEETK